MAIPRRRLPVSPEASELTYFDDHVDLTTCSGSFLAAGRGATLIVPVGPVD